MADDLSGRIYSYGCRAPHICAAEAREQMRLSHKYRNRLCEIELERRRAAHEAVRSATPELVAAEAEAAELTAQIEARRGAVKAANAAARSRTASAQERDAIKQLQESRRVVYERIKSLKSAAYAPDGAARVAVDAVDEIAASSVRAARAECGVYWGTYLTIEQAARSMRQGAPPRFLRWDGGGRIAVQLQGGLSVDAALGGEDSRLRLVRVSEFTARGKARYDAYLRIGSNPDRSPQWCVARATLHRIPPAGARIKWAWLLCRPVGPRMEWSLQIVLAGDAETFRRGPRASSGMVAIDLGWRALPDRLRVAVWRGSDGQSGELSIPRDELSRWTKLPELRSIRDRHFDEIRPALAAWIAEHDHPEWFAAATKALVQWRSSPRLRGVVERWRSNRFDGDAEIFARCESWREREKHLHLWESGQALAATRWRLDLFRNFAAMLRRRYAVAIVERANWRDVQRRPEAEAESSDDAARKYARIASVGRLVQMLRESLIVEEVAAEYTTQRCHACGEIERFDSAAEVWHTCAKCGLKWDQDHNAAAILLALKSGTMEPASAAVMREDAGDARDA